MREREHNRQGRGDPGRRYDEPVDRSRSMEVDRTGGSARGLRQWGPLRKSMH